IVLGNTFRHLGKYREAEKAYRDAESIFRRNENAPRAGDALNRLAAIQFTRGEFDSSLKCLLEAVEHARKENNNRKLAYLFGNIGRVYTLLGKLNKAEENIRFNIRLSQDLNDEIELARAYLSLGYVNIQQAKYEAAEMALEAGLQYIKKNNMAKEEIIYRTYSGELLLKTERASEAEQALYAAAGDGRKIAPESLVAARPLRHLAELYAGQGNYRKALQIANRAMVTMKKIDDSVEIGALQRIQAICHAHLDSPEKAREAFCKSIATLEECKARFELADSLAEAGGSELFGASQRTMYMCRAEEIYSICGVTDRANEMQRRIGALEIAPAAKTGCGALAEQSSDFPTKNDRMKEIVAHLHLLKESDIPILLIGETGTGKDHLAQYFHSISRPDGPFIPINCAAMPDTLIESELFGYHKGAFTGAEANRRGLFLAANGGVLLLDEIGELPVTLQAKLLDVLESKTIRPLGTTKVFPVDVIVIAATNRNLYEMVEEGTFRRDLFYRLAGITLELPLLRERKEDIPYLLEHFMRKFGLLNGNTRPESELLRQFVSFDWPGNIRQLENKVKQLSVLASMAKDGSIVELARSFFEKNRNDTTNSLFEQVEQFEKQLLVQALITAGGNKSEAARLLSIHESTFRAKMKRYELNAIAG
ncbi:MAG: sigma 54-interacting transcriptional regulator, partial [Candidatus Zixiibacteriota bacterium]